MRVQHIKISASAEEPVCSMDDVLFSGLQDLLGVWSYHHSVMTDVNKIAVVADHLHEIE